MAKPNTAGQQLKLALLLLAWLAIGPVQAQNADTYVLEFGGRAQEQELRLSIGKSQIIRSTVALDQVVIGNPEVADIKLLSSQQVLILGIKPGHTNLVFKDKNRSLVALMDVVVGYDLNGIKRKVFEAVVPTEPKVEIRGSNDSVILSGEVSNVLAMERVLAVARSYVPEDKVVNLMQVAGGHQVMLEVKIAEVSRNSLKDLGVDVAAANLGNNPVAYIPGGSAFELDGSGLTLDLTGTGVQNAIGTIVGSKSGSKIADFLAVQITALEQKGLAKTLAEPNIVAQSGQEASFLVGGEVPVPVLQSGQNAGAITVAFREFGIGLKFTPTVLSNRNINLKLTSEVSAIDESRAFSIGGGIAIPSFTTRRVGSTVEMSDGQSFAIAGLLQNDIVESIRQFPWLGDIPVLGALFRSNSFQREETELVVIVTPRLVKPSTARNLKTPAENFVAPSQADWYLLGRLEGRPLLKRDQRQEDKPQASAAASGGFEGAYGHE